MVIPFCLLMTLRKRPLGKCWEIGLLSVAEDKSPFDDIDKGIFGLSHVYFSE